MGKQTAAPKESKMVKIRLPRLPGKSEKEQVLIVGHNFKNYRIKRGENVYVPRAVADRIESTIKLQEENDRETQALIEELAQK